MDCIALLYDELYTIRQNTYSFIDMRKRHQKLPNETPKLGEKGWLVAANAIILAALMVWLQSWRDTLRYYSDNNTLLRY